WSADQREFHRTCLSYGVGGQYLDHAGHLVPGQHGGGLRLSLAGLRCWPGEEPPAFLWGRPLLDELEEDAARRPAARAVFGEHAAVGLTLERVRKDGGTAVLAQHLQDLREQGAVGFLEGLR